MKKLNNNKKDGITLISLVVTIVVLLILFAGTTPLTDESGYMFVFFPITVPGFNTLPQPTSTLSPSIAPIFFIPVSIFSVPFFITINFLSDFTFDVIEPAPIWDLYPNIESPT